VFVTYLRLDLATDAGETLVCTDIVLNPEIEYQANSLRFLIYILVLFLAAMVSLKFSQQQLDAWFYHWEGWIIILFGLVIVSIDLSYPLVFTYDSGHYLWLSELIEKNEFANWDIIRNLIFPLHLFLSKQIFTDSNIGLKIPMIIYHLGLYFSLFFPGENGCRNKERLEAGCISTCNWSVYRPRPYNHRLLPCRINRIYGSNLSGSRVPFGFYSI